MSLERSPVWLALLLVGGASVSSCAAAPPETPHDDVPQTTPPKAPKVSQVTPPVCPRLDYERCKAACDAGQAAGCTMAMLSVHDEAYGTPEQRASGPALLEKGCNEGDVEGCRWLGLFLKNGRGMPMDVARGEALIAKAFAANHAACDAGRAEGCQRLASMTREGWGTPADVPSSEALSAKAAEIFVAACGPDDPASCGMAGEANDKTFDGTDADRARARGLYEKGCKLDDGISCYHLGVALHLGNMLGLDKDRAAAAPLLRKACDRGISRACDVYADQLREGEGVPKDVKRAIEVFERACHGPGEMLSSTACLRSADLRVAGGEAITSAPVRTLIEKACRLGDREGCRALDRLNGKPDPAP